MANTANITERGVDGIAFEKQIPASQPGDVFPAGVVVDFAGAAAPTGWLICDGSAVSRATYPNLFSNIGTTHGAGDGSTTFNIPDCRGKTVHGKAASGTFQTLGATGGAETHVLTTAELPVHSHSISDPGHGHSISDPGHTHSVPSIRAVADAATGSSGAKQWGTAGAVIDIYTAFITSTQGTGVSVVGNSTGITGTNNAGSGSAHSIVQPYIVLNKIIRAY